MKQARILLSIAAVLVISSCDSSTEPTEHTYDTQGRLAPYAIGDKYAFQVFINGTLIDTANYEVINDTLINDEAWQIHQGTMRYTLENSPEPVGLEYMRRDANGLTHSPGVFSLMTIDRSKSYDPLAVDTIGMYVNDSADVRVSAGNFKNAVNFRSSKPYIDRSIYAPGVGMIYRETSNSHMKLLYAEIGGKVYGRLP